MDSLNRVIEHTILSHGVVSDRIIDEINFVKENRLRSIVVPSSMLSFIRSNFDRNYVKVVTVSDFPLGYSDLEIKVDSVKRSLILGADEVDFVINYSHIKNGNYTLLEKEMRSIREVAGDNILKAIIEISELNLDQIDYTAEIILSSGIDYLKTSTGFSKSGADPKVIKHLRNRFGSDLKIKASGGIRTYSDAIAMVKAGADLIGCSKSRQIINR